MQKAKERYSGEKAAEYYLKNKETIKEMSKNRYRNLSKEEKDKIKEYQRKIYQKLIQYKKKQYKIKKFCFTNYKNEWKETKIWQYLTSMNLKKRIP